MIEFENSKIKLDFMHIYISSVLKNQSLLFHLKYDKFSLFTKKILFFCGKNVLLGISLTFKKSYLEYKISKDVTDKLQKCNVPDYFQIF